MTKADGLRSLDAVADRDEIASPGPWSSETVAQARHLWIVGLADAPYALEACSFGRRLESGVIKHTNLNGGAEAHCGGELWFLGEGRLVINGSSGRYGPRTPEELSDVAEAMRKSGYEIGVVRWSEDLASPPEYAKSEDDLSWLRN